MTSQGRREGVIRCIKEAARSLLPDGSVCEAPYISLLPLSLALEAFADTLLLLQSPGSPLRDALFSGDEDIGPNIYTRLKTVRDLCSASIYPLHVKSLGSKQCAGRCDSVHGHELGVEHWSEIIRCLNSVVDKSDLTELSRLLDDVYDAAIGIVWELHDIGAATKNIDWREVSRHACHIRDHFDYAESMVLNCILPAAE